MGQPEKPGADSAGQETPDHETMRVHAEFEKRWWRQVGISGQVLLVAFPTILAVEHADLPPWALAVGGVSVLVGIVGSLVNWRCPSCSSYFGKRFFGLRHCPSCGVSLKL